MGIVSRKGTRPFVSSSTPVPPTQKRHASGARTCGRIPHRLRYARWVDKMQRPTRGGGAGKWCVCGVWVGEGAAPR
jgi:hypothetical protein